MRWWAAYSLGAALTLCLCGCRSCDKVESELRARESDLQELHEQLDRSEFHNHALTRELLALRGLPGPHGVVEAPSEPYPVRSIVLGRRTGGRASETLPGDDALGVQVEPRDPEGSAIKAPGTLIVEAQEVTIEGLKRPLSTWQVLPHELRNKWQSGLFTTGYVLTLPWKVWPSTDKMRIIARFQLLDGRVFEADKDVTIRVLPENLRKTLPPPAPPIDVYPPPTGPVPFLPGTPAPPPTGILPSPLPPATPLPPGSTLPAPTPVETEGPRLMRGQGGPMKMQLLRPIPMPLEP
jgi:hypothetical protein